MPLVHSTETMSDINRSEIDHLSSLARVYLSPEEAEEFSGQLPEIVDFVDQLSQVSAEEVSDVPALPVDKLRPDKPSSDSLTLEQVEKLAPEFSQEQVVVPPVLSDSQDE